MKHRIPTLSLILAVMLALSACGPGQPAATATPADTLTPLPGQTNTARPPTSTITATRAPSSTPTLAPAGNLLDPVVGTVYAAMTATAAVRPTVPTWTPGPTTDPARIGAGTPQPVSQCQQQIRGLLALHDAPADENFFNGEAKTGKPGSFDPASSFQVLNRLSMQPGYRLDYVYFMDELGGRPLLYARKIDQAPFASYDDYLKAVGGRDQRSYEELDKAYDYLQFLRSDDTSAGYFQYVAMATMGNQFYLWWHGLYNDFQILCSYEDLQGVQKQLAAWGSEGLNIPAEVMEKASKINYTPTVHLTADSAVVRVVGFSKWGGVIEEYFTLSRTFPHNLLDSGGQILVEWDCGIAF